MRGNSLWRLIVIAFVFVVAVSILNYIIRHLLGMIVAVAIVAAILWMILNAAGRKRSF